MERKFSFTSESVTEGHPDKVADQISDAILDAALAEDSGSKVDCETLLLQGTVIVTGQITTTARIVYSDVVRGVLRDIGLDNARDGIDWKTCGVLVSIEEQSPDISVGVNRPGEEMGAGDQGIMFGYASDETEVLMPMPILLAHRISRKLAEVRKQGLLPYLRPDGKSQVTVDYADGVPVHVGAVVVAAQHNEEVEMGRLRREIIDDVVIPSLPDGFVDDKTQYYINETGRFVIGGTRADTGITGRKIVVDTYGGFGSHGGGCFSGKDPTKVDRSGSYMARYVAKNIVGAGLAGRCSVQLAYAIGVPFPVSLMVDTLGTGKADDNALEKAVRGVFNFRPGAIIRDLDLLRPVYRQTACYGHFGREDDSFTWERTDRTGVLLNHLA